MLSREDFAALPLAQRLKALYEDPNKFLAYCVFTRDERDSKNPVKPAPVWPKEALFKWYIEPCMNILDGEHGRIIFDKSRRMWISYLILSYLLYHAITHTDQRIGIITENATKSQEHLNNIKRIYEAIPEKIWPAATRPKLRSVEGALYFDEIGCIIHGLASGPDQARQYGFSKLFFDEMDFWDNQELTWAAAVPTTTDILVASTHRMQKSGEDSFYKRLVNDEISDAKSLKAVESRFNEFDRYMPEVIGKGLKVRRLPKSQFILIELDYWADPARDNPEWIEQQYRELPAKQVAVEIKRSWETFAGTGVYDGAFFNQIHVLKERIEPNPNYPIFRGWDFGGNQSCAITQIIGERLIVIDEIPNGGLNTETFAPQVISFCSGNYDENFHYIDIIDPSAMWDTTRARTNSSCADVMRELDLHPVPAPSNDPKKRIGAVITLLKKLGNDGQHNLLINPNCTMLIKGFEGGYHYPEKVTQSRKMDQPVKNLFSHIHDALQYVALRLISNQKDQSESAKYERQLTTPSKYRFTTRQKS